MKTQNLDSTDTTYLAAGVASLGLALDASTAGRTRVVASHFG